MHIDLLMERGETQQAERELDKLAEQRHRTRISGTKSPRSAD